MKKTLIFIFVFLLFGGLGGRHHHSCIFGRGGGGSCSGGSGGRCGGRGGSFGICFALRLRAVSLCAHLRRAVGRCSPRDRRRRPALHAVTAAAQQQRHRCYQKPFFHSISPDVVFSNHILFSGENQAFLSLFLWGRKTADSTPHLLPEAALYYIALLYIV